MKERKILKYLALYKWYSQFLINLLLNILDFRKSILILHDILVKYINTQNFLTSNQLIFLQNMDMKDKKIVFNLLDKINLDITCF